MTEFYPSYKNNQANYPQVNQHLVSLYNTLNYQQNYH